ncbi:hypothetical protein [Sphingomonas sp.]|uniref:hypothetical protein n=1 Tax=Sphingomonas sp. TaxID=28214 RepID=UPI00342EC67D
MLWRTTRPDLPGDERERLVRKLLAARRAIRDAENDAAMRKRRAAVQAAKVALGQRGPVW